MYSGQFLRILSQIGHRRKLIEWVTACTQHSNTCKILANGKFLQTHSGCGYIKYVFSTECSAIRTRLELYVTYVVSVSDLNEDRKNRVESLSDDLETVLIVTSQETGPHEREHWHYVVQHSTLEEGRGGGRGEREGGGEGRGGKGRRGGREKGGGELDTKLMKHYHSDVRYKIMATIVWCHMWR